MKHIAWPVLFAVALLPACDGCNSKRKTVATPCTTNADCNVNQVCNGTECVDAPAGGSSGMASSGTSAASSGMSSSSHPGSTSSAATSSGTSLPATSSAVSTATSTHATSAPGSSSSVEAQSSSGPIIDATPPFIISTTPANLAANVPRTTSITVVFSEQMNDATVSITTEPPYPQFADHAPGTLQWSFFTAAGGYPTGTTLTVTVNGTDLAGNPLSAPTQFSFSTIPNNWDVVNWDEATWQ